MDILDIRINVLLVIMAVYVMKLDATLVIFNRHNQMEVVVTVIIIILHHNLDANVFFLTIINL